MTGRYQPGSSGDESDALWRIDEFVPSLAGGIEEGVVSVENVA
jgi:hypothetical protein